MALGLNGITKLHMNNISNQNEKKYFIVSILLKTFNIMELKKMYEKMYGKMYENCLHYLHHYCRF